MNQPAIVSATDVRRRYGEGETAVDALAGVTLSIPADSFTAIMGPSGSGKSTLLDGVELANLDDKALTELRRDKIGFVFQTFNLLPVLSAEENIVLPLKLAGRKPDQE